jgi:hypothetical protein
MQPSMMLRHVKQLTGHLAALSRFISKLGEKALPFYQLLRKMDNFTWTEEAHAAFDDLKRRLSFLSSDVWMLPEKIRLLAFISSNSENISCVSLLKHKNSRKQGTGTVASCQ